MSEQTRLLDIIVSQKARIAELEEAAFRVLLRHRTRIAGPSLVYYEYPSEEMEALVALLEKGE